MARSNPFHNEPKMSSISIQRIIPLISNESNNSIVNDELERDESFVVIETIRTSRPNRQDGSRENPIIIDDDDDDECGHGDHKRRSNSLR